jgi:3-dehydroquinate dehydratase-2
MKKVLLIHGPNLNLLGKREPEIYGSETLEEINKKLVQQSTVLDVGLDINQFNSEELIITCIHQAFEKKYNGLIINPGAYTHTSIAIRDAISATKIPTVEVHLSNIHAREEFRQHSYIAPIAIGQICGFGSHSYLLALDAMSNYLKSKEKN